MQSMFIYHMPNFSFADRTPERLFPQLAANVRAAEQAGFDTVTVMDHFYQIRGVGPESEPMLESGATLGALAQMTTRVRIGALVTGVTYRNPALVAKQITTIDAISGGRAMLGIGAAWNEDEHVGYGFEFPGIGERLDRLEEALQVCRLLFTEERPSFEGRFYRLDRALNVPRPIQRGGPPILIGGGGERRTLRLLAKYGDIGNWFGTLETLLHKKQVFEEHCAAVGRDPSEVRLTIMAPIVVAETEKEGRAAWEALEPERRVGVTIGTPEQCADVLRRYVEAGFGGFVLRNPTLMTVDRIALAGEVIRLVKGG